VSHHCVCVGHWHTAIQHPVLGCTGRQHGLAGGQRIELAVCASNAQSEVGPLFGLSWTTGSRIVLGLLAGHTHVSGKSSHITAKMGLVQRAGPAAPHHLEGINANRSITDRGYHLKHCMVMCSIHEFHSLFNH